MTEENIIDWQLNDKNLYPVGRGTERPLFDPKICICIRSKCGIICRSCGFFTMGRIREICPVHPKCMFLMDMSKCSNCSAYSFMMQEINIKNNRFQKVQIPRIAAKFSNNFN